MVVVSPYIFVLHNNNEIEIVKEVRSEQKQNKSKF